MLILTRCSSESIKIGKNITITVLGIRKNQVRIGIDAPMSIDIHREEIYARIQEKQRKGED